MSIWHMRSHGSQDRPEALLPMLTMQISHDFAALGGEIEALIARYQRA